jgi:putative ABC transport system ATP-binding protein
MIIEINKLHKTYKNNSIEVNALIDVSFEVAQGDFIALMGPSGSGKSTLMNILGCLDRGTSGTYYLDGTDISTIDKKELAQIRNRKIGFVFQAFNLLPRLSALQNVELPMVYARVPAKLRREKALLAIEKVGLLDRIDHRPNELSGGQKQRIAIARALVNKPAILLADEPTGNLDSFSSEEIMGVFQKLNEEGVTILMVTHEPDIAMFTRRKITFRDGKMLKDEIIN